MLSTLPPCWQICLLCCILHAVQGKGTADAKGCIVFNTTNTVDCSHRSLNVVPNNTFPTATEKLDLSFNNLTQIYDFTFHTLINLTWLDLSNNNITTLGSHAFVRLSRLLYLNINSNNILLSNSTYPSALFVPLRSLQVLHMEGNDCGHGFTGSSFPAAVSVLSSLQELYTDFPKQIIFPKVFSNLKKLRLLSSSGFSVPRNIHTSNRECCVTILRNETFIPFSNIGIKHFRLANSCLKEMQLDSFAPLRYMESFDLSGNQKLGLYRALQSMQSLKNRSLSFLSLRANNNYLTKTKDDYIIGRSQTRYMRTICVQSLDIAQNFIYWKFPKEYFTRADCLKNFDMSVHLTDPNWLVRIILHNKPFPNLQFLNISSITFCSSGYLGPYETIRANGKQETVIASNLTLHTVDISFLPLKCDTYVPEFHTLTVLNISGWNCSHLRYGLFMVLTKVTSLSARQAQLNTGLWRREKYVKRSIFTKMVSLREIDLSGNELISLPDDLFLTNYQLASLQLEDNKLNRLPMEAFKTTSLTQLDLSNNVIQYLTSAEISTLELQKRRYKNFHIRLGSNPFICTCETLEFLQWLNRTSIVTDFDIEYTCRMSDGRQIEIVNFMETFTDFSVTCVSKTWLNVVSGLGVGLIVVLCCCYMYYKHRWNIRYWFYTQRKPTPDMFPERQFDYDVFVCYNHNDCPWVYRRLRPYLEHEDRALQLCLHHRDFPVGVEINQNIVDAINNSRKIILVISRNFVRSSWGEYEIEMAGMRSVHEGRTSVIISVLLEEVPIREMPRTLMNLWHRVTFLEWSDNPLEQESFWVRLMDAINLP